MGTLKLIALDSEDLQVIAANLQDAVARVGDLAWLPDERRFVLVANRFDWTGGVAAGKGPHQRRRTALHFERVEAVKRRGLRQDNPDAIVNLLTIRFDESDAPGGCVEMVFSGGGAIRLDVECLEARLSDLGPAWSTESVPSHDDPDAPGTGRAGTGRTGTGRR